jgi:hypothetical protein
MPGALRGIHERGDAELARAGAKVGNRIHRAHRVRDVDHREQLHLLRQQRIEFAQVEHAFIAGDGHVGELRAGALGEQLPRHEVAVMLHFREQNHVAGLEIFRAPGTGDQVDALGGAARENDFLGAAGVDEFGGARPGGLVAAVARLLNSWMPRWTLALSCS